MDWWLIPIGLVCGAAIAAFSFWPILRRIPVAAPARIDPPKEILVKMIYVLADMRGVSVEDANDHRDMVKQRMVSLLQLGIYPVSVGVNTEYTMRDFALPAIFEEGGKELAARCDGILLMPGWSEDPEAKEVYKYAHARDLKTFVATEGNIQEKLKAWATE
jgi:hypothetical protein